MRSIKHAKVGLFVFTIAGSGAVLATCPNTMPLELLTDCIVYEGEGASSPPIKDYAYMDRYLEWLKTQPQATIFPTDTAVLPIM